MHREYLKWTSVYVCKHHAHTIEVHFLIQHYNFQDWGTSQPFLGCPLYFNTVIIDNIKDMKCCKWHPMYHMCAWVWKGTELQVIIILRKLPNLLYDPDGIGFNKIKHERIHAEDQSCTFQNIKG